MGLVYFAMGQYADALTAYRRGLAIREQLGDHRALGVSLSAIGQVEARTNPSAALRTYQQALALRRETGDTRGEMATELNVGTLYRQTGDLSGAGAAFRRALALGDRIDAPLMRSNALRAIADIEAARDDYASAYTHMIAHQDARDQMFSQESGARLTRLQLAHEAGLQQQQIESLEQEGALRDAELRRVRAIQSALAVIAILVLVSLGLLYARFRLKQRSEARFRAQAQALSEALERVQTLRGLLPICGWCKKIRDDNGYWTQLEAYISDHSEAEFTHSICPPCSTEYAAELSQYQAQAT